MGPSWDSLGPPWGPLGPSEGSLGPSWGPLGGLLGRLGAILGVSWAVLERREDENAKTPKSFKNHLEINDFCLSGPSWEASWRLPGASWRPLGPSWGHLGRLRPMCRCLETVLGSLGGLLGLSWHVFDPSGAPKSHATTRAGAQGVCAKPKKNRDEGLRTP